MCGKMAAGIGMVLVALWLVVPGVSLPVVGSSGVLFDDFLTVVLGTIPALLLLIGGLLTWIEWEERKFEKPKKRRKR